MNKEIEKGSYIYKGENRLVQSSIALTSEQTDFIERKGSELGTNKSAYLRTIITKLMIEENN